MKNSIYLFVLFATLFAVSCGSSKKVVAVDPTGGVEVAVPFSEPEYQSDDTHFRANAMGFSNNLEIANNKALAAARAKLASYIETVLDATTDNYLSSYEENMQEQARARYQSLSRSVVSQTLVGVKVIGQKTTKNPDGVYNHYVAIELPVEAVVKRVQKGVSDDSKLRTDFEYEKYKSIFEQEMANIEQ